MNCSGGRFSSLRGQDVHPPRDRPTHGRRPGRHGVALLAALLVVLGFGRTDASLPPLPAEQHPGLLFTSDDLPVLRQRLTRQPYAGWWQTVLHRAQSTPASFAEERDKVRWAKSLAFAYLMTDSLHFARQAVELLRAVRFPPRGGELGEPHHEGEVVAIYATAYDMLHPFLEENPVALAEIRDLLAEEAERLYAGIEVKAGPFVMPLHLTPHLNNWHLRVYGGLGLAAWALSDYGDRAGHAPQAWAERAFELVVRTLTYQIEEVDGGFAEGPFYLRYAADVYLPYLFALRNRQGIDLFVDPRVRKAHAWSLNLRLPSGRRPNVGDAHLDDFYGHYLAAVDVAGPVHRWDWENNCAGLYVRQFAEMDAIALYDDAISAQPPSHGPSVFMPGAGDAVFRSDWSSTAVYLLLRGEHGPARTRSLAHGHADETSFILYAGGEMLALDSGYIEFAQRHKVNAAANHNLILIDGQGPPLHTLLGQQVGAGNDAYLRDTLATSFLDYAEVETRYRETTVRRRVFFPGHRYFAIADELFSDRERQYEWLLHGNGGGASGGTYSRLHGHARWRRCGAELLVFLPPLAGRTFSESEALHSFNYREELTHTVLRVGQQGQEAAFLAVLYPLPRGAAEPQLEAAAAQGGQAIRVTLGDTLDLVWLTSADSIAVEGPGGWLTSDARSGWVRHIRGAVQAASVQDGAMLEVAGRRLLQSSGLVDAALQWSGQGVSGFARGSTQGFSLQLPLYRGVAAAHHRQERAVVEHKAGSVCLELSGEGALQVETAAGQPADFDGSGRVDWADFLLLADAFGQSAAGLFEPFDLDGSGRVDWGDFLLLADAFGR